MAAGERERDRGVLGRRLLSRQTRVALWDRARERWRVCPKNTKWGTLGLVGCTHAHLHTHTPKCTPAAHLRDLQRTYARLLPARPRLAVYTRAGLSRLPPKCSASVAGNRRHHRPDSEAERSAQADAQRAPVAPRPARRKDAEARRDCAEAGCSEARSTEFSRR